MHFLVAFAPKLHVQLEFLLGSKIDLASPSREVCRARYQCNADYAASHVPWLDFICRLVPHEISRADRSHVMHSWRRGTGKVCSHSLLHYPAHFLLVPLKVLLFCRCSSSPFVFVFKIAICAGIPKKFQRIPSAVWI